MENNSTIDSTTAVTLAENRLLNAIYLDPNLLDSPDYSESVFVHTFCKTIAGAIDEMSRNGSPINSLSLYNETSKRDMSITKEIIDAVIGINTEPVTYIKDITDFLKSVNRSIAALNHIDRIREVLSTTVSYDKSVLDELRDEFDIAQSAILSTDTSVSRVMSLQEWGDKWEEDFNLRKNGKRYWFNEPVFDSLVVDGPTPGACTLLTAASGMGKSTAVLKLANGLINSEVPCIFYSLEMGSVATFDRLLSTRLQIPYSEFVNPSDEETFNAIKFKVQEEREKLNNNKRFRFCEDASISLSDIRKGIIKLQESCGQQYCIVILDLVTMVQDFVKTSGGLGMAQQMEIAINALNALAKELGVHFICTAQMNRECEKGSVVDPEDVLRFRPTRAGIKNSGALLERARTTISLFRKKYYLKEFFSDNEELLESEEDLVEFSVLKQNNGECRRLYELFDGSTFTITPIEKKEDDFED